MFTKVFIRQLPRALKSQTTFLPLSLMRAAKIVQQARVPLQKQPVSGERSDEARAGEHGAAAMHEVQYDICKVSHPEQTLLPCDEFDKGYHT